MYKMEFKNAVVRDDGFGLEIDGKRLEEMISIMLGTRVKSVKKYDSNLPHFRSNNCDVTVIINPTPSITKIETDETIFDNFEEMEDYLDEQYQQKATEAEKEE